MKRIILIIFASLIIQPVWADWTDAFDNPKPMYAEDLYNYAIGGSTSYDSYNDNTNEPVYNPPAYNHIGYDFDIVRDEWDRLNKEEDAMRRESMATHREREARNDYRKSLILNGNSRGKTYSSKYNPLTGATDFTSSGRRQGSAKYNPLTGAIDFTGSGIENGSLKYNPLTGGMDFR